MKIVSPTRQRSELWSGVATSVRFGLPSSILLRAQSWVHQIVVSIVQAKHTLCISSRCSDLLDSRATYTHCAYKIHITHAPRV